MFRQKTTVKTLAQQIRWQLLYIGAGLFLACVLLLLFTTVRTMQFTSDYLMAMEADSLLRLSNSNPDLILPSGDTLRAYFSWQDIPLEERQRLESKTIAPGRSIELEVPNSVGEIEYLYFLHHINKNGDEIFLISRHPEGEIQSYLGMLFIKALQQSVWMSLIIFTALFFLFWWLIRRTSEPLALLSRWAEDLGKDPKRELKSDFPIQELNDLAANLHNDVCRIREYNLREQRFLKYASHELRTPLAIVQVCLDTLRIQCETASQRTVQRALKACGNMRLISNTLLWLARESDHPVEKSDVLVKELYEQLFNEHLHLTHNRDIQIQSSVTVRILNIERELFSIVISNLIRNAFQYSSSGTINLSITQNEFCVTNPVEQARDQNSLDVTDNFGLGVQLVNRICKKLCWNFHSEQKDQTMSVSVKWGAIG